MRLAFTSQPSRFSGMVRFHNAAPNRFSSIGWMDWSIVKHPNFAQVTTDCLHRMIEHGPVGIEFWKDLGLTLRDIAGSLLRIDDDRFAPILQAYGEMGLPVMFQTADPTAFFSYIDANNERYEKLAPVPTGVSTMCLSPSAGYTRAMRP